MLKNHLKIAFRQLSRNKVFSGINILGLSLGMALAVLIAVFIKNEYSYDNWMPESEYTYRVYRGWGGDHTWSFGVVCIIATAGVTTAGIVTAGRG